MRDLDKAEKLFYNENGTTVVSNSSCSNNGEENIDGEENAHIGMTTKARKRRNSH